MNFIINLHFYFDMCLMFMTVQLGCADNSDANLNFFCIAINVLWVNNIELW